MENNVNKNALSFLQGGGEMGKLIRSIDWAATPLGSANTWPVTLKQNVIQMLNNPFPMLICWGSEYTQLYNDAFRPINGATKHPQALGGSAKDTYAEIWETIGPMFAGVMQGEAVGFPNFMVPLDRNGYLEDCYFDFSYSPIKDENGQIHGVLVICMETTEKVRALNEIKASKQNIQNMIRQAPVGMCLVTGTPLFVEEVNDLFLEIIGKKREPFHTIPYWEAIPEAKAYYEPITDNVMGTGETYHAREHEIMLIRNGVSEMVHVDFVYEPMRDIDGTVTGIMIVATEVTDKVMARRALQDTNDAMAASNEEMAASNEELVATNEELAAAQQLLEQSMANLAESEERFRTMAENSGILIAVADETSNATYFSKAWVELTGRSMEDLLAFGWVDLVHPDDRARYVNIYLDAFKDKVPFIGEFRVLNKTGNYRWLLASGPPRFRPDGSFAGYISSSVDITERKQEEEARRQLLDTVKDSEAKLDQIINQLPVSITVIIGENLVVESTNPSNLAYWQKSREEVMGKPLLEILPELKDQPFPGQLRQVMKTGETIIVKEGEVNLELPDGSISTTYVDYSYQPLTDKDGNRIGVLVMSNDVSGMVISRNKLEQSEKELQTANDDLLFTIDAAALGTYDLNPITGRFTGNNLLKSWFGLKQDDEIPLQSATDVIAEADREKVLIAIANALDYSSGGKYDVEYTIINPLAPEPRMVRAKGKALFNEDYQAIRLSGTLQDITEQKKDDQRKNDFIGMVSHELKTPLTSLTAIVQVANAKLKKSEDHFLSGAMEKANVQVKKMSNMVNGFLNVTRLESGKMQLVKQEFALDELIKETIKEHELTVTTHIIDLNLCDHVKINADRDKIGSVIANFISNAVKYSPKGKTIKVECRMWKEHVQVSVEDEGMGINTSDLSQVFERYYRVEADHTQHISGFGIGLYLSAEIIKQHNGKIWAESQSNVGSTFYFSLPLS